MDVADTKPKSVHMWAATTCNDKRRDFRLVNIDDPCTCGVKVKGKYCVNLKIFWHKTELHEEKDRPGIYIASQDTPAVGWTAFFVDVQYKDSPFNFVEQKMWEFDERGSSASVDWPIDFP